MNCSICLESLPLSDGSLLSTSSLCPSSNTAICETCMVDYLESEISQAKINPNGTIDCFCLSKSACSNQFSPILILSILPSATIQKYQQFHTNAIVSADPTKIWCPSRTCSANGNGIANIDKRNSHKAKCESCNFTFCSLCKQQHLSYVIPLCKFYQGQNQNQNQDQSDRKPSASSSSSSPSPSPNVDEGLHQWKSEHGGKCKKCPKCRNYIEKNGGCDHMTCKICKHEFCWRCKSTYDKGCTAGKFCFMLAANKHHRWGQSTTTRAASKSVAYPLLAVAASGVVGAGIGVGIAVGAGVVAVGAIAAPVYGSIKLYKLAKESSQEPVQPDPPQQPIQEIRTRPAQLQRSRPFRLPPSHRLDELHVLQNHNDLTPRSSNSSMSEMDLRMAITTRTIQPHVEVYDMLSSSVDFVDDLLDDISRPNSLPFPV